METAVIEDMTGRPRASYRRDPHVTYLAFQRLSGATFIDQYIPENPLSMGAHGFESDTPRGATTGTETIIRDGMVIDGPESVVAHLEGFRWPALRRHIDDFEARFEKTVTDLIEDERRLQEAFGSDLLKVPYNGFQNLPRLRYEEYGYANYFSAYALYPEVMDRDFSLQADFATRKNRACAEAICRGGLPRLVRLDHDMAEDRGPIAGVRSLERLWFPHFSRSIQPYLDAGIRLIWHCDGNLMPMIPQLLEAGIGGFQGFQYECGMDYEAICRMTDRCGEPLLIWAGVSVTRTMPFGSPADVRRELAWLMENGPPVGLILGASSSVCPGTRRENIEALIEGLKHYRKHGRG